MTSPCVAFLADLGVCRLRHPPCHPRICRRLGYVPLDDRRLVGPSRRPESWQIATWITTELPHEARTDLADHLDTLRARRPSGRAPSPEALAAAQPPDQAKTPGRLAETPPPRLIVPNGKIKTQTRRDFLIYGAGVAAAAAGFLWVLPDETRQRLGFKPPAAPDPAQGCAPEPRADLRRRCCRGPVFAGPAGPDLRLVSGSPRTAKQLRRPDA